LHLLGVILLVFSCDDKLDIQQVYPFTVTTMPVPKKLKARETAEIRCQLKRDGRYLPITYQLRFFRPNGKVELKMDNGTLILPNDFLPAEERDIQTLLHLCIHRPTDTIDVYVEDSFWAVGAAYFFVQQRQQKG